MHNRPYYITEILKNHKINDYLQSKNISPVSQSAQRSQYRCPMPQHKDSNPSFTVFHNADFDYYKCFACQIAGDVINLYCNLEKVSLQQAIVHFAKGLKIDETTILDSLVNDIANGMLNYGSRDLIDLVIQINRYCFTTFETVNQDATEVLLVEKAMAIIDKSVQATDIEKLRSLYQVLIEGVTHRTRQYFDRQEKESMTNGI